MLKSSKILHSFDNNRIEWDFHQKQSKKSTEKITFKLQDDNSFNSDPINDSLTDFDSFDEKIMSLSKENNTITCNSTIQFDEDQIVINNEPFKIEGILEECSSFIIYNVRDKNGQEYTLKKMFFSSNFQLCDCITIYNMLIDDVHICSISHFDVSYENLYIVIVFERFQKIDIQSMNQQAIKNSLKQILEMVEEISSWNLKFDSVLYTDFYIVGNEIKLVNFEHLSIIHTQIFRIPVIGKENKEDFTNFNLYNLVEKFLCKNDEICTILKQAQIKDIPKILNNQYFVEKEDINSLFIQPKHVQNQTNKKDCIQASKDDISFNSCIDDENDSKLISDDENNFESSTDELDSKLSKENIIIQDDEIFQSPVDDMINLISKEFESHKDQTHSSQESNTQDQTTDPKNHFNFSQIDFSFSIGTLLMLTISLILKGIHESNFGFGNACEVFFGLRLFWILLICQLFYIVFRLKSQKHKKYISKKIYQYIIVLAVLLFLINASLVFHLFLSRIKSCVPSFTLFITLCWILLSLPLLND